jgi:Type III flagellar switch regulator (C-ring) FliN C-term
LWLRRTDADRFKFGRAVVGSELMPEPASADDWIVIATERAWAALTRAFCVALFGLPMVDHRPLRVSQLPTKVFARGSGHVRFTCDALGLHLIVDGATLRWPALLAREEVPRLPAVVPLNRAVRGAKARIEVLLGSVEVELPKLLDLRCGDLLRLPQKLDEGLLVLCDGQPLARAALGAAEGHKCIRISTNHP